ncbi:MAG: YdeI/OmpD-associated family protein [Pseudomonadota bacterium]
MSYPYGFEAVVEYHDVGSDTYAYTVIFVPDELAAALPLAQFPRLRVTGEVMDHPIEASLTPVRGRWYVLLSQKLLKAIDCVVGDTVECRFEIADQDAVDIPPALTAALAEDEHMSDLWDAATPGKKRALAHRVASAKAEKTQAARVELVFDILAGRRDMRGKLVK